MSTGGENVTPLAVYLGNSRMITGGTEALKIIGFESAIIPSRVVSNRIQGTAQNRYLKCPPRTNRLSIVRFVLNFLMADLGTKQTCCDVRHESVIGGRGDVTPTSAFIRS